MAGALGLLAACGEPDNVGVYRLVVPQLGEVAALGAEDVREQAVESSRRGRPRGA